MENNSLSLVIECLEGLEFCYFFGCYVVQVKLDLIYCYYCMLDYEVVVVIVECFININLDYFQFDYVYYMKGLVFYSVDRGLLECFIFSDFIEWDMGLVWELFEDFNWLINCFFDSKYVVDVCQCMVYLCNLLVVYELQVVLFYMCRGVFVVVVNCGCYVVENFDISLAVLDVLVLMVQVYIELDMFDFCDSIVKVLKYNFFNYFGLDKNGNF